MRQRLSFLAVWSLLCGLIAAPALADDSKAQGIEFFEKHIRPLLVQHCTDCHGEDLQESELRLDTYAGMLQGGASGPSLVPGKPDESILFAAASYQDEALQMPPDGKLADSEIALLKQWIEMGAPHPEHGQPLAAAPKPQSRIDLDAARQYWAFQPIVQPELPAVENSAWVKNPIDAFVLANLEANQLTPVTPASKRALIRRATFDLTGLPPTPEEIAEFLADESPQAFEKVIDRLLASPHYGERWGRHWLDVARYADSNGLDENIAHGNAWRYRDYVIASFNEDKPYDQFLLEQLAGDLLLKAKKADAVDKSKLTPLTPEEAELLIATGFLTLGPKVLAEQDQTKLLMDVIDEQIDTVGKAVFGLTFGCARCHDHKFDPISAQDYYALAGIFKSTYTMESLKTIAKWNENTIASAEEVAAKQQHDEQVAAKKQVIQELVDRTNAQLFSQTGMEIPKDAEKQYPDETKAELKKLRDELKTLEGAAPELPTAMGVIDSEVENVRLHVRGSHLTLGQEVERGVPVVLTSEPLEIDETHSGRLEMARWAVDPKNPLTARVMANRIWRWHFGEGIVSTTDNFGRLGAKPTNPALLDWLSAEFISRGWSIKQMHKLIMLSSTYQMSSEDHAANAAIDPDNNHHWRSRLRRLEAEAIRDSLLSISGLLDRKMGGSLLHVKNRQFLFDHTSKDGTRYDAKVRSVYLPVIRNNLYPGFSLFDYAQADVPEGDRGASTIAPQALFMLNSDLLLQAAEGLADQLLQESSSDAAQRVERLYELTYGRPPTDSETKRLIEFTDALTAELAVAAADKPDMPETSAEESDKSDETAQPEKPDDPQRAAWIAACQAVLASNEFIYIQ